MSDHTVTVIAVWGTVGVYGLICWWSLRLQDRTLRKRETSKRDREQGPRGR